MEKGSVLLAKDICRAVCVLVEEPHLFVVGEEVPLVDVPGDVGVVFRKVVVVLDLLVDRVAVDQKRLSGFGLLKDDLLIN